VGVQSSSKEKFFHLVLFYLLVAKLFGKDNELEKEFQNKLNQLHVVANRLKAPEIDEEIINLIVNDDEDNEKENINKQEYLQMQ